MIVVTIIALLLWLAIPLRAKHKEVRYLLWVVSIYFIQDPLRKLLPGGPPYLQLLFTGMVAVVYVLYRWKDAIGNYPQWGWPFLLSALPFVAAIFVSVAVHANDFNVLITTLGFFTYLFFVPVFLIAQDCFRSEEAIVEFMKNYVLMSSIQVGGVWLEFFYGEQISSGLGYTGHLYDDKVTMIQTTFSIIQYCGFFQSMEPMVFCLALAFMYSITLAFSGKGKRQNFVLALVFFVTSLLGVRRKGLLLFGGVLLFQLGTLLTQRKDLFKRLVGSLVLLSAISLAGGFIFYEYDPETFTVFYERFVTDTADESSSRFEDMTRNDLEYASRITGPLGVGIGYGSAGAQMLSDEANHGPEGGLAAIYWELGVPGMFGMVVVMAGGIGMMLHARRYLHDHLKLTLFNSVLGLLLGAFASFVFSHSMIRLYSSVFLIWLNVGIAVGMAEGDRIMAGRFK